MKWNIASFLTLRGLAGALMFVIVGAFLLHTEHSRMGSVETLLNISILFVLMPFACVWANRRPDLTSKSSMAISTATRGIETWSGFLSILLVVGFAESLFRSWFYPLGILLLIAAQALRLVDQYRGNQRDH
jgi:hypothetical protein